MPKLYSAEDRLRLAHERGIIVDEQDRWLLATYTWHLNEYGYAITRLPETGKLIALHHCILGCPIWEGEEIDHRDRNPGNNTRSNLRYVDGNTQALNRDLPTGETGERNISVRNTGMYKVQIYRDKKNIYLGQYPTLKEAKDIRDAWFMIERMHEMVSFLSARLEAAKPRSTAHG